MAEAQIPDTGAEDYDPFELFDRAQGAGNVRDPYPDFAEQRRKGPVEKINLAEQMGASNGDITPPGSIDAYVVHSHDAVSEVLRDGKLFSSKGYAATMGVVMGHTILEMDEPEHSHYRGLIQQAFTRRALERWERDLVRPIVDGMIDRFAPRGHADLVRELTFPFPVNVIAGMLGLPEEDLPQFHRWAVELISVGFDWQLGLAASKSLADYLGPSWTSAASSLGKT